MSTTPGMEPASVAARMTREQYSDLNDCLDAVACHLDDVMRLEAVVNFYRDRGRLEAPLAEILEAFEDGSPSPEASWQVQAEHKHRDLMGLIARIRCLVGSANGADANRRRSEGEIVPPSCAA